MGNARTRLEDVVIRAMGVLKGEIRGAYAGVVTAYSHEKQRATVRSIVKPGRRQRDGSIVRYVGKPIANVRVIFPAGDGLEGVALTWPLVAGDRVLVVHLERSHDEYHATGSDSVSPQDPRRFDATDAVCLPGFLSFAKALGAAAIDNDAVVLSFGTALKLGSSASARHVAIAEEVEAEIEDLRADVKAHTHSVTTTVSNATPAAPGPVTGSGTAAAPSFQLTVRDLKSPDVLIP